jgi:hypothetical protein
MASKNIVYIEKLPPAGELRTIQGAFVENWLDATSNVLGGESYFPRPSRPGSVVRDCLARGANRRQLSGEDLIAIQQHVHGVAAADRRDGIGLEGRNERTVYGRQLRQREVGRHSNACSWHEAE